MSEFDPKPDVARAPTCRGQVALWVQNLPVDAQRAAFSQTAVLKGSCCSWYKLLALALEGNKVVQEMPWHAVQGAANL